GSSSVTRTGSTGSVTYSGVQNLTLYTSNSYSNNTVNLSAAAAATTVSLRGGNGSDTFNIGASGSGTIDPIAGAVAVYGAGGTNTLYVNDQVGSGGTYTMSATALSRTGLTG